MPLFQLFRANAEDDYIPTPISGCSLRSKASAKAGETGSSPVEVHHFNILSPISKLKSEPFRLAFSKYKLPTLPTFAYFIVGVGDGDGDIGDSIGDGAIVGEAEGIGIGEPVGVGDGFIGDSIGDGFGDGVIGDSIGDGDTVGVGVA